MSDTTMKVETKNANSGNNSYPGQIGRPPHVAGHGFRCWFDFANYHWSSRSCRMLIPARLSCSPFANITGGQLFLKLASIHLRRSKGSSSKNGWLEHGMESTASANPSFFLGDLPRSPHPQKRFKVIRTPDLGLFVFQRKGTHRDSKNPIIPISLKCKV